MMFIILLLSVQQLASSTNVMEAVEVKAVEAFNATKGHNHHKKKLHHKKNHNLHLKKKRKQLAALEVTGMEEMTGMEAMTFNITEVRSRHKKRHHHHKKYTKKELKHLKKKKHKKWFKKDKVGDKYYQKIVTCRNKKDLISSKKCSQYMKKNTKFCANTKDRKVCAKTCCKKDYKMLDSNNKGCSEFSNRTSCIYAKDGRKDKRFSGQACTWCCGHFCTGPSTNLCEPVLWLFQQKNFIHIGENNVGYSTCPGSNLYDGYYHNGYYYYSDGSPYYYGWYGQNGKYHYYYEGEYSYYWGSDEIPGDPKHNETNHGKNEKGKSE